MSRIIQLRTKLPDEFLEEQILQEWWLNENHYDQVIAGEPIDMLKPDGSLLFKYRPGALPRVGCDIARLGFRKLGSYYSDSPGRGFCTGIGGYYYDRKEGRCYMTPFTRDNRRFHLKCMWLIWRCNDIYRQELPEQYEYQRQVASQTNRDYILGETVFTTYTANRWDATHKARTPAHRDKGDLPGGFGVIAALTKGDYTGGYLIFPQWRVAVDLRDSDLLLCDVHEVHGIAPIEGEPGWERISVIMYYRTAIGQSK